MPNYKLSNFVRDMITHRTHALLDRRMSHAIANFPLTTSTLQSALMPASQLSLINQLKASGFSDISAHRDLNIGLLPKDYPGLLRATVVRTLVGENIYVPRARWGNFSDTVFDPPSRNNEYHLLDTSVLDASERAQLAAWANGVVREHRLSALTKGVVNFVLPDCETIGHVMAAWPMLKNLVVITNNHNQDQATWVKRFKYPPRNLKAYSCPRVQVAGVRQLMDAAEIVLTAAELIEEHKRPEGATWATVPAWERLPTDRTFPWAS